jgi:hypothetical protein
MAIINTGKTFTATETVTNTKLQDIANEATFNDPVDETSLELIPTGINAGKLGVKDAGITPAKLSAGGPSWSATGALLTNAVAAPESDDALYLKADPESPDPTNGGAQISLHSTDSAVPNQIYTRSAFTFFQNMGGATVASIGSAGPSDAKDLTTKEYVDAGVATTYKSSFVACPARSANTVFAHSLGAVPDIVNVQLKCISASEGFATGQIVMLSNSYAYNSYGNGVEIDATNVTFHNGPNGLILIAPDGTYRTLDGNQANFEIKVIAVIL